MITGPFILLFSGGACVLTSTVLAYLTDMATDFSTMYFSNLSSGESIPKASSSDILIRLRDRDILHYLLSNQKGPRP